MRAWRFRKQKKKESENALRPPNSLKVIMVDLGVGGRQEMKRPEPNGTRIKKHIPMSLKKEFVAFLKKNMDLFAWTTTDMPEIDLEFMSHQLATFPDVRPITQKRRKMSPNEALEVQKHVQALLDAGFLKEVTYLTWLSNVIMVIKSNGKWHMCIDYTNLNKTCPKYSCPLSSIDGLVDAASKFRFLFFMDAY